MIKKEAAITTAMFDGSATEGYVYADTSYGTEISVDMYYTHKEDPSKSVVVRIGEHLFPEFQIRHLVKELDDYKRILSHVKAENEEDDENDDA